MIEIQVPGSKSITNRALAISSLAKGTSILKNILNSDDTRHMVNALKNLGVKIKHGKNGTLKIYGGHLRKARKTLFCGNSGTTMRFLTAILATQNFESILDGDHRMRQRPIKDLIDALYQLGANVIPLRKNNFPPVKINCPLSEASAKSGFVAKNVNFVRKARSATKPYQVTDTARSDERFVAKICILQQKAGFAEASLGGHCYIKGNISSQFLSGLLIASPLAQKDVTIHIIGGLVSKPYIDMTIDIMEKFGVRVKRDGYKKFHIKAGQKYHAQNLEIEGDASSATYFWGISSLISEEIKIKNIPYNSKQPDIAIKAQILRPFGRLTTGGAQDDITSKLKTIKINCSDFPDGAMTLAVFCAFNKGKFILMGLKNLQVKECDRLSALAKGLKNIGCRCSKFKDGLVIFGNPEKLHGGNIETFNDHRIAMCFGMAQFVIPEIKIKNPNCVKKTYPDFWKDINKLKKHFQQKNIILTGMRGSGKTKLGRLLGRSLGRRFIDTDELIEHNAKMPIALLVKRRGWDHFRRLERNVIYKLRNEKNAVIATGGGTLMNLKNAEILKRNGKIIFLDSIIVSLKKRLEDKTDRPSLTGKKDFLKELNEVYLKRLKAYNGVKDAILDVSQQTNNKQRDLERKLQKLIRICTRLGII